MIFPINELPIDAYIRIMERPDAFLVPFKPTTMEKDLKKGTPNVLIYWFPLLSEKLYDLAYNKKNYVDYLGKLNVNTYYWFDVLFKETHKKLDLIRFGVFNENVLKEVVIKEGKIKSRRDK